MGFRDDLSCKFVGFLTVFQEFNHLESNEHLHSTGVRSSG